MDFYLIVIIGLLGYLVYLSKLIFTHLKKEMEETENDRDILYPVFGRKMIGDQLKVVEAAEKNYSEEISNLTYLEKNEREEKKKPFPSDALKDEIRNFVDAQAECDFQEKKLNLMIEENSAVLNGRKKIKDVKSYLGRGMFFFEEIELVDEEKKYDEIISSITKNN